MGLRFRRSVRIVPGVRLNFSRGGLSTTIGRRGATMTFGRQGTHLNVGLPGSGLSYRTRISPAPGSSSRSQPAPGRAPFVLPADAAPAATEIRSADAAALTTPGLAELKTLINETAAHRSELRTRLSAARRTLAIARLKLALGQFLVVRLLTEKVLPGLAQSLQVAQYEADILEADFEACIVDVDIGMVSATAARWSALHSSYESLCRCSRIWDVTASRGVNQRRERTMATSSVARSLVRFGLAPDGLVRCGSAAFQLGNASGRELQIFPAFAMMREPRGDFGLVELTNINLEAVRVSFVETHGVPSDSQVLGQTWIKANKDGSRDRRFSGNRQIPIAEYGELTFKSATGLLESYQFSSYAKSRDFAAAFSAHADALRRLETAAHDPESLAASSPDVESAPVAPLSVLKPRRNLWMDWMLLGLIIVVGLWLVVSSGNHMPASAKANPPPIKELSLRPAP
jgi:hypothetical protein